MTIELLGVPLLLHEAWRQHAESLLREYLLASLDLDPAEDLIVAYTPRPVTRSPCWPSTSRSRESAATLNR